MEAVLSRFLESFSGQRLRLAQEQLTRWLRLGTTTRTLFGIPFKVDGKLLVNKDFVDPDAVKIVNIDSNANTIAVDGGDWLGSDGTGTAGGDTKLSRATLYDTTLTLDGPRDLAEMAEMQGAVVMTDGAAFPSGEYRQAPYKLTTTGIESVVVNTVDTDISRWSTYSAGTPTYYPGSSYGPFDPDSDGYIYGTTSNPPTGSTLTLDNLMIAMPVGQVKIRFQGKSDEYSACDYVFYNQDNTEVARLEYPAGVDDTSTVVKVDLPNAESFLLKKIVIEATARTTVGTKSIGAFGGIEIGGVKQVEGTETTLSLFLAM